jgi:hypothetical protein
VVAVTSSCQSVISPNQHRVFRDPKSHEPVNLIVRSELPTQRCFSTIASGTAKMLIMTEDGERTIHDDLILCMDRPQTVGSLLVVTLYLLTGERIIGVVGHRELEEFETLSIH